MNEGQTAQRWQGVDMGFDNDTIGMMMIWDDDGHED